MFAESFQFYNGGDFVYEKIKQLCKEKGIAVRQLEGTLGFSNGSICKWDKSVPRADALSKVANYLGVSIEFLLDSSEEED